MKPTSVQSIPIKITWICQLIISVKHFLLWSQHQTVRHAWRRQFITSHAWHIHMAYIHVRAQIMLTPYSIHVLGMLPGYRYVESNNTRTSRHSGTFAYCVLYRFVSFRFRFVSFSFLPCSVLSCPALSCPAPSRPVPSRPVPSRPVPSRPVPSRPVPSRPVPSRPVPSRPVPSRPVPSRPVPSVPSRPVPSRPVLSCPVLSCPVLSISLDTL